MIRTYCAIAILLIIAEAIYFRLAARFNIVDRPNDRGSSTRITLRGGGIVFVAGVWLWAAFCGCRYPLFLAGLTLISFVSFIDDIRSVPNSIRLAVQFVSMFMMFYELGLLQWHLWWAILIAVVVCVGIMNAYNFMDGVNGITGGYSLTVLLPLIYLNVWYGFVPMSLLICVVIADLIFCFLNFRKNARCFAGDVGSIGMAFILVFVLGRLMLKTMDFSYITLLAVYGVDTVLTICHRIILHENLGVAHRKHTYQIMANELRIGHVTVSLVYMIVQMTVAAGLLFLPVNHYIYSVAVIAVLSFGYVVFMKKFYYLHAEYLSSVG